MPTKRKRGKNVAEVVPTELDEMTHTGPIELKYASNGSSYRNFVIKNRKWDEREKKFINYYVGHLLLFDERRGAITLNMFPSEDFRFYEKKP